MKNKTCCFSGHRIISKIEYPVLKESLYRAVCRLAKEGVLYFGAGGALGFDTMAAEAVLAAKQEFPQIKLILVYPCKDQTKFWKEEDIKKYEHLRRLCDKYVYVSETYSRDCMFKRNRHLVDNSAYCICYLTKSYGGTAQTVNYARQKGLSVINLASL